MHKLFRIRHRSISTDISMCFLLVTGLAQGRTSQLMSNYAWRCTSSTRVLTGLFCPSLSWIATVLISCEQRRKVGNFSIPAMQVKGAEGRIVATRPSADVSQPMSSSLHCSRHRPKLQQWQELSLMYGQSHDRTLITANPAGMTPVFLSFLGINFHLSSSVRKGTKPLIMKAIHSLG